MMNIPGYCVFKTLSLLELLQKYCSLYMTDKY